jgi:hypothetical protein
MSREAHSQYVGVLCPDGDDEPEAREEAGKKCAQAVIIS